MGTRNRIVAVIAVLLPAACSAQVAKVSRNMLTNRDVVTLATAGFSEEFIIETITTSRTQFDTSADGLADLAKNGVTEQILRVMRQPAPATPVSGQAHGAKTQAVSAPPPGPPRVFIESSPNAWFLWQSHPQTVEVMKTFGENCPNLIVTNHKEEATFTVVLEHEAGKLIRRDNKMVIFDRAGDMVFEGSKRELGNAVRDFCHSPFLAALKR